MAYRKFQANQLFEGNVLLSHPMVLVTDDEGIVQGVVPPSEADGEIQHLEGILSPGFVNCHCHLELSHMKNAIPEKTGMIDFILAVLRQRHVEDEFIYSAVEQAEREMIQNGIVAVGDICNNTLTLPQKSKGNLYYHNFIEVSGFVPSMAGQRFERSLDFFKAFARQYAIPIESNSLVPHAPYSVSPELLNMIVNFPGNHIFSMHNQECTAEEQFFKSGEGDFRRLYAELNTDISFYKPSGVSSLQTVLPAFKKNQNLILVHNVTTTQEDIRAIQASGLPAHFCLCPNANLYIGNELPDLPLLLRSGYPLVLGTDSLASNHQLSILKEMETLQQYFPDITIEQVLQWATLNGAKALQLDGILGSFEKGKQPGLILIGGADTGKISGPASAKRIL